MKQLFLLYFVGVFCNEQFCENLQKSCITFSVAPGTGCEWMCNYCAKELNSNNYYFTDNVCKYSSSNNWFSHLFDLQGCIGSPEVGKEYTCCSNDLYNNLENITIYFDNSENNEINNPPGYTIQVVDIALDGQHNVIVNSNDKKKELKIPKGSYLLLLYYLVNDVWKSYEILSGHWINHEIIKLPKINNNKLYFYYYIF